jgi:phenylacetate-coenzyme A ligase PaaK-like adenylate-forming protein
MLRLPGIDGSLINVIADGLSRVIAQTLPLTADYRLIQTADAALELYVDVPAAQMPLYRAQLNHYLQKQGVATSALHWTLHASMPDGGVDTKRRRIIRRPARHTC